MGLETATFINGLVSTNPIGASDPKSQGDDHLRLIKSTLLATFPNITGAITSDHTELNYLDGATGVTGTGNTVRSASPTFTGTVVAATINATTLQQGGVGASLVGHAHAAGDTTSGTFADARIAQSNVTQHQAALTTRNISGKTGTAKTLSTSAPSGGSDGDIWYRY